MNTTTPNLVVSSRTSSTGTVPMPVTVTVVVAVRSDSGVKRWNVRRSPTSRPVPSATVALTKTSSGASPSGKRPARKLRELEREAVVDRCQQAGRQCRVDAVGDAAEPGVGTLSDDPLDRVQRPHGLLEGPAVGDCGVGSVCGNEDPLVCRCRGPCCRQAGQAHAEAGAEEQPGHHQATPSSGQSPAGDDRDRTRRRRLHTRGQPVTSVLWNITPRQSPPLRASRTVLTARWTPAIGPAGVSSIARPRARMRSSANRRAASTS